MKSIEVSLQGEIMKNYEKQVGQEESEVNIKTSLCNEDSNLFKP